MKATKMGLVLALSVALILTGCPSGGGNTPDPPGSGRTFTDDSQMRVSVGPNLNESARSIEDFQRILIQGDTADDTSFWVVPRPKASDGRYGSAWISYFKVEYKRIVGTHNNPQIGPTIVDEYFVTYRDNGEPIVRDRYGNEVTALVVGLVQWSILREVVQTVFCASWNFWVGLPWCVNVPGFKSDLEETEVKAANTDCWLQLIVNTYEMCSVTWSMKYVAEIDGVEETEFISGHLDMDFDSDGLTNCEEIENGTDPYDPNDPGQNRKVPGLIGKTVSEAQAALAGRDLVLGEVKYEYSSVQPKDRIFDQDPNKGTTVPKGSAVDVWVSKGVEPPNTTIVPNVVGQTLAQAGVILADASLQVGTVSQAFHPTAPAGQVVGQSPIPGSVVPIASSVNLTVSKGPEPVNPLSASFTSPTNGTAFESGDLGLFKMSIVGGVPPFTVQFLFETGPIPGWQEGETSSRTPQWSVNLNSTAEPGPTNAHAYGRVTDSTGAQTPVFSVSYTVH
jgi:hypothetical protein